MLILCGLNLIHLILWGVNLIHLINKTYNNIPKGQKFSRVIIFAEILFSWMAVTFSWISRELIFANFVHVLTTFLSKFGKIYIFRDFNFADFVDF